MIQARHISFNIEYGCFIKPLEIHLSKTSKHSLHFGKGNYDQIAARIDKLRRKYRYYTELDHDSFDAHITQQMLSLTHKFYLSCYHHNPHLRMLSKRTLVNFCKTRQGDTYTVSGTRMSGDVDTSLGNSLINYAILKELLFRLGLKGEIVVCGDDSIIFTNQPVPIEEALAILRTMNMNSKMPKESTLNIHTVDFCKTKFVIRNDGTPTMMFDPDRLYSSFGMTHKLIPPQFYPTYLYEVAYCHGLTHSNTPLGFAWLDLCETNIHCRDMFQKPKFVDVEYLQAVERQRKAEISTRDGFTDTMFIAYPDLIETMGKIRSIFRRPMRTSKQFIEISHDIDTLRFNCVINITKNYLNIITNKGNNRQFPTKKLVDTNTKQSLTQIALGPIQREHLIEDRDKLLHNSEKWLLHTDDDCNEYGI